MGLYDVRSFWREEFGALRKPRTSKGEIKGRDEQTTRSGLMFRGTRDRARAFSGSRVSSARGEINGCKQPDSVLRDLGLLHSGDLSLIDVCQTIGVPPCAKSPKYLILLAFCAIFARPKTVVSA